MLKKHKDIQITNLDKMSYGANPANLKDVEKEKSYNFVKGDICDRELVSKLLENIDAIVNFAAESHVDRSIADPWPFFKSNSEGVLVMLEIIRSSNEEIRYIQVGTDESYGSIPEGSFVESDKLEPSSIYSASKASADIFCLVYHKTYGLDTIVTRCTNNFGPFQFPEKLIPKSIIRAYRNLKVPIYGSGRNVRDWIYVNDHCDAIEAVVEKGESGEIYNISSGNELKNIEIVEKILDSMQKPKSLIEYVEDRPGHDMRYSLNSSKIEKELGWKPKHQSMKALKETVDWYLANMQWWKPLIDEQILHPTPWKLKWQSK